MEFTEQTVNSYETGKAIQVDVFLVVETANTLGVQRVEMDDGTIAYFAFHNPTGAFLSKIGFSSPEFARTRLIAFWTKISRRTKDLLMRSSDLFTRDEDARFYFVQEWAKFGDVEKVDKITTP